MTIEIKRPELEALIHQRLKNGAFQDIDELLTKALQALPEDGEPALSPKPRKRLIDILMSAPFAGSELKIERLREYPPPVEL